MAEVWLALAAARWPGIYLAIRFGLVGGVALGARLFDALTALALSAAGWALPVEAGFPAAIGFRSRCSAAGERA